MQTTEVPAFPMNADDLRISTNTLLHSLRVILHALMQGGRGGAVVLLPATAREESRDDVEWNVKVRYCLLKWVLVLLLLMMMMCWMNQMNANLEEGVEEHDGCISHASPITAVRVHVLAPVV